MNLMNILRLFQVIKYGFIHSNQIKREEERNILFQIKIFIDMLICFGKYRMWTNQYLSESFYKKNKTTRKIIGKSYYKKGKFRDEWQKDFVENRKFLNKYSQKKYELPMLRDRRNKAYSARYNTGKNCHVEHGVELTCQHYLIGSIKIGNNVLLAKNCFIDYSGSVIIKDKVKITADVIIESHYRDLEAFDRGEDVNIPTNLVIEENAYIGVRSVILASCNYIGKNSRIGAGAVVTKNVPDNVTVAGVPAKIVRDRRK